MKKLWQMMHDYQDMNVEQKGINFSEEGFTQLFDETVKAGIEHIADVRTATVKGVVIGAAGVGLTWLGVAGVKKFRKRKSKKVEGTGETKRVPKKVDKALETEVIENSSKKIKKVSKTDKDALKAIIDEVTEGPKSVKH